jgi:hypothetical protein
MFRFAFAIVVLPLVGSCHRPAAGTTRVVSVAGLAQTYRDDPGSADILFTGQLVKVRLSNLVKHPDPLEIPWQPFYGAKPYPPTVVFRFDSAPPPDLKPPVWIEGTCRGRVDDDQDRGIPGYTFTVTITGCTVLPSPQPQ